jgi:hypothetical protein
MSESGFWVPAHESRDWEEQASSTPIEDFGEARRQPPRDTLRASSDAADEAAEGRLLKELWWMRRYVTEPTDPSLPPHVQKRLRQMENYVCQAIDAEITKSNTK